MRTRICAPTILETSKPIPHPEETEPRSFLLGTRILESTDLLKGIAAGTGHISGNSARNTIPAHAEGENSEISEQINRLT